MGEPRHTLQGGDVPHQPKLTDIFAAQSIVATLERDTVIPDRSMSVYRLMQFAVAVIGIQLELVGCHGVGFLAFISYSAGCGRHHLAVVRNSPHESHHNYIMF